MATKLIFQSSEKSEFCSELICYSNANNEIFIEISHDEFPSMFICLDKPTAIKLSKTLKTEISKLDE